MASERRNGRQPRRPAQEGSMAEKILIVDDEEANRQLLAKLLDWRGFDTIAAGSAEEGLRLAYRHHPDLVLLDIMMPGMDGWEVCRRLRELSDVPIVFLTVRNQTADVVRGLELGADDYITKPYDNEELVARVRAHLRRAPQRDLDPQSIFEGGPLRVNFLNREVYVDDHLTHLTPKEFNLLSVLVRHAGRVVTRTQLVREAWGDGENDTVDGLKLYIHYLRQKLEPNPAQPQFILTSRGVGYRFVAN